MDSIKSLILAADDRPSREHFVKEWKVWVTIVTLGGAERDQWELSVFGGKRENIRAKLLVLALQDKEGKKIFGPDDVEALGGKSGKVLEKIYDIAAKLNGIREGDIKELEKNSEAGPSAGSGSDSR